VRHVRIEDGSGRQLGRSYGVRLWPTLVFLRDGVERARLVRPRAAGDVAAALQTIDPGSSA
jgi:thioredoxin 1